MTLGRIGSASLLEIAFLIIRSVTRFKIVLTTAMKPTAVSIRPIYVVDIWFKINYRLSNHCSTQQFKSGIHTSVSVDVM